MLENILYALTQISLLCAAGIIVFDTFFSLSSQKQGLKIAKIGVLISAGMSILFYNKSFYPPFFDMSAYTSLTYIVMCLIVYSILTRSAKWYAVNNSSFSNAFAFLVLILLVCYSLFITTTYWVVLIIISFIILFLQYMILRQSQKSEELYHLSRRYGISVLSLAIFVGGILAFMAFNHASFSPDIFAITDETVKLLLALSLLMIFVFLMGVAPFHFAMIDCISHSNLPIAVYFHLVPLFGVAAIFLKYQRLLSLLCSNHLSDIYLTFGIISIVIAVIGIHSTRFLRQIFASTHLYILGVWFIFLSLGNKDYVSLSLIYLTGYLVSALGADTCLYYFKSGSQDIDHLNSLAGLYASRPYLTSAFIFFILSLSGLPPFLGFVMELTILKTFALSPWLVGFVLAAMLLLLSVYLKIIYTISFLPKENTFDRVDFSMYVWLLFYAVLVIFLMVHPTVFFQIEHLI